MPISRQEIFNFINATARSLEAEGEGRWANKLQAATQISFMPGELFREIRMVLREFQRTTLPANLGIAGNLADVLASLDEILSDTSSTSAGTL
jgi:hypothetical protein